MVFSSVIFIFYFLPALLAVYYIAPKTWRNAIFLLASLFFYAWGEARYVILLLVSILLNYGFGLLIGANSVKHRRKVCLALAVACNLGFLGLFKYTGFILQNLDALLGMNLPTPTIHLPMGISFYTFQAISYVIDVYRGDAKAQKKIAPVAYYIAAFPRLIVGPISRFPDVIEQIEHRTHSLTLLSDGISRFIIGLAKKILLSVPLGLIADDMFNLADGQLSLAAAWIGILCYTLQIYFDFSGYSDMAIGLGKMFGFTIHENFNYPYISRSAKDFWRRWHISLSQWFRDYVYIPLGGSHCSNARMACNLLTVWLLTGLWHGAAWTFIVWGLYYGVILLIERHTQPLYHKLPRLLQHVYTLLVIMVGWVFFRSETVIVAGQYLSALAGFAPHGLIDPTTLLHLHDSTKLLILSAIASTPLACRIYEKISAYAGQSVALAARAVATLALFLLCVLYLVNSNYQPFIYFRF